MRVYYYTCPFVIISSILFTLFFARLQFHNKVINYIATSTFAIYLLHCNPLIEETFYLSKIRNFYTTLSTIDFWYHTVLLLISFFSLSILIDIVRRLIWDTISHIVFKS